MKILRLILGDQLNQNHSWFKDSNQEGYLYLMMEMRQETDYVPHHIQKIIAFFDAMRSFNEFLIGKNLHSLYYKLDNPKNTGLLESNILQIIEEYNISEFQYQEPDEYRLDEQLKFFCKKNQIVHQVFSTEHFLTSRMELSTFFQGKKQFLMESFYRMMRKKHNILMDGKEPLTGKWNYDHENRNKFDKKQKIPVPIIFENDVSEIIQLIKKEGIKTIGNTHHSLFNIWPKSREQALQVLNYFIQTCLPNFGKYQDSMYKQEWSLFHSRISFAMNIKMISPLEVIHSCLKQLEIGNADIASVEGFIRQILGWREYMRGIYWMQMPEYATKNYFDHNNPLPDFYWSGETKMNCLSKAINQSLDYAYAHHIQRLMITGNFALLAGIHPDALDEWYLGIYIDAIEWVEITNTRGMSQYADGGIVGSKPYNSSAAYIHKMSDYCGSCHYDYKEKFGKNACPFNTLYWNFYHLHRDKLEKNPRIGMMYRTWDKMGEVPQEKILNKAKELLENINSL